jgi:hypothetical protein
VTPEEWSQAVAEVAADALVDAGLLRREDFAKAAAIVAEEIAVRLALGDYPPGSPGGSGAVVI